MVIGRLKIVYRYSNEDQLHNVEIDLESGKSAQDVANDWQKKEEDRNNGKTVCILHIVEIIDRKKEHECYYTSGSRPFCYICGRLLGGF